MPAAMKMAAAGPTKTVWTTTTTTSIADVDCHGCATLVMGPPIVHAMPQIVGAGGQGLNADYVSCEEILNCGEVWWGGQ